jgi:hypothetical protein
MRKIILSLLIAFAVLIANPVAALAATGQPRPDNQPVYLDKRKPSGFYERGRFKCWTYPVTDPFSETNKYLFQLDINADEDADSNNNILMPALPSKYADSVLVVNGLLQVQHDFRTTRNPFDYTRPIARALSGYFQVEQNNIGNAFHGSHNFQTTSSVATGRLKGGVITEHLGYIPYKNFLNDPKITTQCVSRRPRRKSVRNPVNVPFVEPVRGAPVYVPPAQPIPIP